MSMDDCFDNFDQAMAESREIEYENNDDDLDSPEAILQCLQEAAEEILKFGKATTFLYLFI